MFVSIRRYFVHKAPAKELAELVDQDFADRISAQPGFVSYDFLDGGEGEALTISAFHQAAQAENSRALARRWVDEALSDFELTTLEAVHGQIKLMHATAVRPPTAHPGAPTGFAAIRRDGSPADRSRNLSSAPRNSPGSSKRSRSSTPIR